MLCPKCGNDKTAVLRSEKKGAIVERARKCKECKFIFSSEEKPILIEVTGEEIEDYEEYMNED